MLQWPIFKCFVEILEENRKRKLSHGELGAALKAKCDLGWRKETAKTNAKIMLDWARHLNIAPDTFAYATRGQFMKAPDETEISLFDYFEKPDTEIGNK